VRPSPHWYTHSSAGRRGGSAPFAGRLRRVPHLVTAPLAAPLAGYDFASQGTAVSRTVGGLGAAAPALALSWGVSVLLKPVLSPRKDDAELLARLKPEQWPTARAVRYAAPIGARLLIGVAVAAAATGGASAAIESLVFRPTVTALEARGRTRTTDAFGTDDDERSSGRR